MVASHRLVAIAPEIECAIPPRPVIRVRAIYTSSFHSVIKCYLMRLLMSRSFHLARMRVSVPRMHACAGMVSLNPTFAKRLQHTRMLGRAPPLPDHTKHLHPKIPESSITHPISPLHAVVRSFQNISRSRSSGSSAGSPSRIRLRMKR